jgi:Phage tail assembly chaperone protein
MSINTLYYVDPATSQLYAYEEAQVTNGLVKKGLVPCDSRPSFAHKWVKDAWVEDASLVKVCNDSLAASIRNKRDQLLAACDYTQLTDSPPIAKDWKSYRQSLRDIPAQEGFPSKVDWPVIPS